MIFRPIVPNLVTANPGGILLIATNPVDVLTYTAWRLSGLPKERVIGSGTILDTASFRFLLSRHFGTDPRSLQAHIIGEHGDSEVPACSLANVAGVRLRDFCSISGLLYHENPLAAIFRDTRDAAYHIIERKGAAYYAVAAGLMRIVEAIQRDQHTVLSVSSVIHDYEGITDVALSLPCTVGRRGIEQVLKLPLSQDEWEGLRQSAMLLKARIAEMDLPGN